MEDFKLKLTIKSIIKWEQLTECSYQLFDYENIEHINKLLYCMLICNNDEHFDYETFLESINNQSISNKIYKQLNKVLSFDNQFSIKKIVENIDSQSDNNEPQYIKNVAALLVVNAGLSANYVMNEMTINDIDYYMNAYNNKIKQDMESNRLWTFLNVIPHIDSKKIDSPDKFFPFPWELEATQQEQKQTISSMKDEFEMMMKNTNNNN